MYIHVVSQVVGVVHYLFQLLAEKQLRAAREWMEETKIYTRGKKKKRDKNLHPATKKNAPVGIRSSK